MIKLPILKLIILSTALLFLPTKMFALTPSEVFEKVKRSIVIVNTLDDNGKVKGQGSGVLLSSGQVATNCHVVEGGIAYQIVQEEQKKSANLYAEDRDKDICLLDAKNFNGTPAQLGSTEKLKVGVPVYAVGAPQGLELSLSNGIISQLRGGPPPFIQTTAAISPGSSGGGLFNEEGQLVGLTTLYLKEGQSLNFAMPVEWISEIRPGRKKVARGVGKVEWGKRAIALENSQNWQGLLEWCQQWAKNEPQDGLAWFCLGFVYSKFEHYHKAIDAYRQVLRTNPENRDVLYPLGTALSKTNRYNEGIEIYRQAVRVNPRNDAAWFYLGYNYFALKRYKEAIDAFTQSLSINPNEATALYSLGLSYLYSQDRTAALDVVKKLQLLNPEQAEELFNMIVPR